MEIKTNVKLLVILVDMLSPPSNRSSFFLTLFSVIEEEARRVFEGWLRRPGRPSRKVAN